MIELAEPLAELFTRSRRLVLNFADIPAGTPPEESIAVYFHEMEQRGKNPRLPMYRQAFNERMLDRTGDRYLVSSYAEDRSAMLAGSQIAAEGRTLHLGIDIFSRDLEPVLAPCDGRVVRIGREPETHSFGNYVILQPEAADVPLLFFGHLSFRLPPVGPVTKGTVIGQLGDYGHNENGGWSRHLHLQCLEALPPAGKAPLGYASPGALHQARLQYPDPVQYFPNWTLR